MWRQLQRTRYSVHVTAYTLQRTRYSVHVTAYTLQRTRYSVHVTAYTLQRTCIVSTLIVIIIIIIIITTIQQQSPQRFSSTASHRSFLLQRFMFHASPDFPSFFFLVISPLYQDSSPNSSALLYSLCPIQCSPLDSFCCTNIISAPFSTNEWATIEVDIKIRRFLLPLNSRKPELSGASKQKSMVDRINLLTTATMCWCFLLT